MKTTILFPFRRISISFFASVALLGFHTLCAEVATVQTDAKTTSASPVERVAQASTRAHFGTQPLRRMGDWADDPNEAAQLQSIFDSTRNAYASIAPGPDEGAKRKAVSMELTRELESFLQQHPSSGWAADLHLQLALACQLRSSYSKAIEYYSLAWEATKDFEQNPARQIALEAAGPLARLLAVTGRNAQLETLRAEAQAAVKVPPSTEWNLGFDLAAWFSRHPGDAYRCGLYCLDQLARLSQAGPYDPMSVLRVDASLNGFTAGELVAIGRQANLPMRVVFLSDLSEFPVPCIVHLKVEHFVVVRERRGEFYEVQDPVAYGRRWLTAAELAEDASGCLIVAQSVSASPTTLQKLQALDTASAANYRGRCHTPTPYYHGDPGSCPGPDQTCPDCAPGPGPGHGPGPGPNSGCKDCQQIEAKVGMPDWLLSEQYANLWIYDTPLTYNPAYGPKVPFTLAYNGNRTAGDISGFQNQGALAGNYWDASWLSYAEVDASGNNAEVSMPGSGWTKFAFQAGATNSDVEYRRNIWLEKLLQGSSLVGVRVHERDGSYLEYGNLSDQGTYKLFFITGWYDPSGNKVSFNYNTNSLLSSVTFADNASFQIYYNDPNDATLITLVTNTASGASITLTHSETGPGLPDNYTFPGNLTSIIDAAGISNNVWYPYPARLAGSIVTPYGTTRFSYGGAPDNTVFDYWIRITRADSSQEFFGWINSYAGTDWPAFATSQIPTSTPVNTLDITNRNERNTFFWDSRQFSGMESKDLSTFNWSDFKKARIRHWLASTVQVYTHFDTLSIEQAPSPDGGTTEGFLTWYDYAGKPLPSESGTQVMPSVISRVTPDGSTWYQNYQYTSIGYASSLIEKWVAGGSANYRTNTFNYAANGIDLLTWYGPNNEMVSGRSYNGFHEVLTDTNAVGYVTTYTYETSAPHRLLTVQTPGGLLSTSTYGGDGRLQNVVDSMGGAPLRTNSYTWLNGDVRTQSDPRGLTVTNSFDGLHRLTRIDYPDTTYTQYSYSTGGGTMLLDLTGVRDRLGYWTYFGYDALRRKIFETNANNVVTAYGYCNCGALEYVTNALGTAVQEVTHYVYDNQGNRTQIYFPDNTSRTNTYDALTRLTIVSDALGSVTNAYDNLNRLATVSNYSGQVQAVTSDIEDRAIYVTDANGVTVTNTYDNISRLFTRTYPDTGVERFSYTARGLTNYVNQLSKTNWYVFDAALRKTFETNGNTEVIRYSYNPASDLLTLIDGKNQTNTWNYDLYGRVTNKLDQASVEILRYQYDADSRLTNRWSKAKGNTAYTYDNVGNLTLVNYPSSTDTTLSYDALNRMTNMVDAAGTTKFTYYAGGLLATEDGPWSNDTVTNFYNNARLRSGLVLQQPTGTWTNGFTWDAAHRLSSVTSPAGTFTNAYVGAGRLVKKLALPNTSYITNTYDNVARLTGTYLDNSANTILDKSEYLYNAGNQRIRLTRTDGSYYTNNYDNIGQLTWANSTVSTENRGYLYDAAWNLNTRTNNGVTTAFNVDVKNQLTSVGGSGCTYDFNGNLLSSSGGNYTNVYDAENRLTTWTFAYENTAKTDFVYDGLSRLRKRTEYTWIGTNWAVKGETRYVYDGMRVIQERNSANTPTASYTRGCDLSGTFEGAGGIGGLLARSDGYSSGSWTNHNYYHADGGGNITYLVDSSQNLAASYRYDPFGNTISSSGTLASTNIYRFSSKEFHTASGMYYYGYRFYDPNLQRWLNRDPIDESGFLLLTERKTRPPLPEVNRFAFVGNDSPNQIDSLGLLKRYYCEATSSGLVCDTSGKYCAQQCKYHCTYVGWFNPFGWNDVDISNTGCFHCPPPPPPNCKAGNGWTDHPMSSACAAAQG